MQKGLNHLKACHYTVYIVPNAQVLGWDLGLYSQRCLKSETKIVLDLRFGLT